MPFRYDLPSDDDSEAIYRLRRLAEILQCEPEAFFSETDGLARFGQDSDLWRLWCALASDEKRRQALEWLRALVGAEH